MMSQNSIIFLWFKLILFKIDRIREQASSVLELYYQTQTPDIVVQIFKKKLPWGKTTQQAIRSLNSETTDKNWIRTVAVIRKFIRRLDIVIDKKKMTSFGAHSLIFLNKRNIQFVKNLRMFMKFVE